MGKRRSPGVRARVLQPGKVVVVLAGRFAGKKAVIVRNHDDGTSGRAYGHAMVVGLQKEPRKVGVQGDHRASDQPLGHASNGRRRLLVPCCR
jgi:hypothetical protein